MKLTNKDMYGVFKLILCCLHNSLLKPSTEHLILKNLLLILANKTIPSFEGSSSIRFDIEHSVA